MADTIATGASDDLPMVNPPAFYAPLLWPFLYVYEGIRSPDKLRVAKPISMSHMGFYDNILSFVASLRSFLMAYAVVNWLHDEENPYPAWGKGETLHLNWIVPILIRNVLACWGICGFWDWFLYLSPWQKKLAKFKMNPAYPSITQLRHDALHSTIASVCGTAIEVWLCHGWSNGYFEIRHKSMSESPLLYAAMAILVTHLRIPHFYFVHRVMHPWRIEGVPDVGKFLYRKVHSLHHKSYNPTAFSGTSMHVVEATLYYSAGMLPVLFAGLHPVVALAWIIDCAVGAWLGHDGFQWPGSGDYFHHLHHKHFDCNYGASHVPMDQFFGTFAAGKEDIRNIWRSSTQSANVGEEGNATGTHSASKSDHVE